jgi:1,4-alpha-glucan branching enzyme
MAENNIGARLDERLLYLYNEGKYYYSYQTFGAHPVIEAGHQGVRFTVWAPNVKSIRVIGDYNAWKENGFYLTAQGTTGVWSGFLNFAYPGMKYKYLIETMSGELQYKADPYAFYSECRPGTASIIRSLDYLWHDDVWMSRRNARSHFEKPKNIYEVHLGSWKQHKPEPDTYDPDDSKKFYTYRELTRELIPYVQEMGYTHIELLPVMEHPLDESWGYQITGYFSATSRYGTPQDLMEFIETCHKKGIGVILDWVPGHFCRDEHGLGRWGGEMLYEGADHRQWGTYRFDFSRSEVRGFLLSNALFWLDVFHADGLRVDGVSSMLYLNFGLDEGEPHRVNKDGGEEDLDAIAFLQDLARVVGAYAPSAFTVAEESSAWPLVTAPPEEGGLGFHYKWDMGWMNDTLKYMATDFPYRPYNHNLLTFSMMYAFNENFMLPLSHDEVVHGKCSLIRRMPGDYWRQFAGLRLLAMYQITHPGGVLNFMGNEFGQFIEWNYDKALDWLLLDYESHSKHRDFIRELNNLYTKEKALWMRDKSWYGFKWLDADNAEQGILLYLRQSLTARSALTVVLNTHPETYTNYRVGVPAKGYYREIMNSDEPRFGGSGKVNPELLPAQEIPFHGQPYSIEITVPPVGGAVFKRATGKKL